MALDDALVAQIPDTLTGDLDGKAIPLREHPFIKEVKDFPSFVKGAYDAHREVGARIPVKVDAAKPEAVQEWRKNHLPTLYKNGLLEAPPADPKEYGVVKPTDLPEGLNWSDERATKYAGILHKYGVPKAIVPELMELHKEALLGQAQTLKTSVEQGMAELKKEWGEKFEERAESAKRLTSFIFKNEDEVEFFSRLGLGNHPGFLGVMMRLSVLAENDSSMKAALESGQSQGGGGMTGDEVRSIVADIMNNKENPKYKLYWGGDKKTLAEIEEMYKKAYGTAQVTL